MLIPQPFPAFLQPTALIVSSRQGVDVYVADRRRLDRVGTISVPRHGYSDRAGLYFRGVHGSVQVAGAAHEPTHSKTFHDLLGALRHRLPALRQLRLVRGIVLAVPRPIHKQLTRLVEQSLGVRVMIKVYGSYRRRPVMEIIRRMSKKIHQLTPQTYAFS